VSRTIRSVRGHEHEDENGRLKRLVADLSLDREMPHSLDYKTPQEFAQTLKRASYGKDAGYACLENASGVSHLATDQT
jgi:hypothetical protein